MPVNGSTRFEDQLTENLSADSGEQDFWGVGLKLCLAFTRPWKKPKQDEKFNHFKMGKQQQEQQIVTSKCGRGGQQKQRG